MAANLIINGGFETGSFPPWNAFNAVVTSSVHHSGSFSAQLMDGSTTATIYQFIDADFSKPHQFSAWFGKVGALPSPLATITIAYFDASFNYLGLGLVISITPGTLPDATLGNWSEFTGLTTPSPAGTVLTIVSVSRQAPPDTSNVVVDDVS
ncbi:MAG TPA: NTTRR-F1 domain, partial [Ruminiclostridium sp.]|nr:NTTRR-F1 domain [Ruminiclostridium sp.]